MRSLLYPLSRVRQQISRVRLRVQMLNQWATRQADVRATVCSTKSPLSPSCSRFNLLLLLGPVNRLVRKTRLEETAHEAPGWCVTDSETVNRSERNWREEESHKVHLSFSWSQWNCRTERAETLPPFARFWMRVHVHGCACVTVFPLHPPMSA